jgi:hypothetical protein
MATLSAPVLAVLDRARARPIAPEAIAETILDHCATDAQARRLAAAFARESAKLVEALRRAQARA